MKTLPLLLSCLLLAACQSNAVRAPQPADNLNCAERICTLQYDPVCATIVADGHTFEQTFGNNCMVCTEKGQVVNTREGACNSSGN